jgi:H+/gluconate symporter-like permease
MYNNKTNLFLRSLHPDRSSLLIGIIFYFLFFIFSFLFFANIYSQEYSADEKKILTYQDTRDLGPNKELLNYLKSSNEKIVTLTLNALANISDSMTVDEIGKILLSDPRT